jgi:hypothetical protein
MSELPKADKKKVREAKALAIVIESFNRGLPSDVTKALNNAVEALERWAEEQGGADGPS